MSRGVYQNSSLAAQIASYSSASSFAAGLAAHGGISNAEAHSVAGTPTFINSGVFAQRYRLASGSLGKGTGSTTGTASGTACDMRGETVLHELAATLPPGQRYQWHRRFRSDDSRRGVTLIVTVD